jgi:hypothetical protein
MCHLIDACNKASYTLRLDVSGLAAFLLDNTTRTLTADAEEMKQRLTPRDQGRLPDVTTLDDSLVVMTVQLYAQRAADIAYGLEHFDSLSVYPTGGNRDTTAESYLDRLYERSTGELLWHVTSYENGMRVVVPI